MTPTEPEAVEAVDPRQTRWVSPAGPETFDERRAKWASGWRQAIFPGMFLFYLAATADGVSEHSSGVGAAAGYVILLAFAACYMRLLPLAFGTAGRFWGWYLGMVGFFILEIPFAHQDAAAMVTYIVVPTFAAFGRRGIPIAVGLVALATWGPLLVPSWDAAVNSDIGISAALVALAMYGFFQVIRSNRELSEARSEVARLATESERSRIARDLHDLLGHSLTTITVKAGLARRLSSVDPERAAVEIAEVEGLARRSLAEVRAAVAGYREVTLTGELASGRELLRAAGIQAAFPGSTDEVADDLHELFGWVVREGLTNVVRHSRATRCTISLGPRSVEIRDDGHAASATDGSGLAGVRERLAEVGGTLEAGPTRDGWRVRAEVPALVRSEPAVPIVPTVPSP